MDDITLLDVREKFPKSYKEFETWYLERESGLYPWLPIRNYWKDITDWMDINGIFIDCGYRRGESYSFVIYDIDDLILFDSIDEAEIDDFYYNSREESESNGLFKLFELREQML